MRRKSQRQMNHDRLIKDEVQEILAMFRALQDSYDRLSDKGGINAELITFDGFDGNNEDEYLRAAREIAVATRGADVRVLPASMWAADFLGERPRVARGREVPTR